MAVKKFSVTGGRNLKVTDKPVTEAEIEYRIICDDAADGPDVAKAALPFIVGSPYSVLSPGLTCREIDVKETNDDVATGVIYTATLNFSTEQDDKDKDPGTLDTPEDPTERAAVIRLGFDSFEESVFRHLDPIPTAEDGEGNPIVISGASSWGAASGALKYAIVASNGKPFPEGLRETYRDPTITITKNVETSDFAAVWRKLIELLDSVNSIPFGIQYRGVRFGVDANTAWLADCTSEPGFENGVAFEAVTLTFKIRADGWLRRVLDQHFDAYRQTDYSLGKEPPPILDANGDPITHPARLDGKGKALKDQGKAVFLKFRTKKKKSFRDLSQWIPEIGG